MIKANLNNFKSDKVIDLETAARTIAKLKSEKKIVGMCHGAFDLMHPGHIKHLESSSKLCDSLFVSITSDRYVAQRKGTGRPIFPDILRAYSVASLMYIDFVVISDFSKATEVIKKLKPSYYIKGPDFASKTTPGITEEREVIESVGGKIIYTSDEKLSTTEILSLIRNPGRKKILLAIDRDGTLIDHVNYLGREKDWKKSVRLKKEVVGLLNYIKAKNDPIIIAISNQQGVARGYFTKSRVDSINKHISKLLKNKKITIDNWQYCPDVDIKYANAAKEINFMPEFIKKRTSRKPNLGMLYNALNQLNMRMNDFDKTVVLGNGKDDFEFAKNLNAIFIDVTGKTYQQLKEEFDKI